MGIGKAIEPFGSESRFLRLSLQFDADLKPNGLPPEEAYTNKFIILGQGAEDRMICDVGPYGSSRWAIRCHKGIDGPPNGTDNVDLHVGQWDKLQIEVRGGVKAAIKLWLNNNNYEKPTAQSTGNFSLESTSWKTLGIGFYHNGVITRGGAMGMTYGDVEWSTRFDPAW
jgi:hypothetical protein